MTIIRVTEEHWISENRNGENNPFAWILIFKSKNEGSVILRRRTSRRCIRRTGTKAWRRKSFKWKSHRIGFISDDVKNERFFQEQHFNSLSLRWIKIIWAMKLRKYIKFHNIWCFICSVYTHLPFSLCFHIIITDQTQFNFQTLTLNAFNMNTFTSYFNFSFIAS